MKKAPNVMIAGTGMYAPDRIVPNSFFNEKYGMDIDSFLRENRNIHQRHFMSEDQATSDLIVPAARRALAAASIAAEDIDLIIVSTDTPDYPSPSTASVVQYKLGAKNAGTFDLNSACAGFVTALDVGSKFIQADSRYRNILVVGAYGMSKHLNWGDHKIASLFADGAGAVVLRPTDDPDVGILASQLYADGQFHDYMGIYGGGTHMPATHEVIERKDHQLNFAKKIPQETNGTHWPRLARILLDRTGLATTDISHFFLTQINIGSINEALDRLGVDRAKSHNIMDRYGYTGSACIPMALDDAARKGKLKKGEVLLLIGSGGGLSMASMALRWGYDC